MCPRTDTTTTSAADRQYLTGTIIQQQQIAAKQKQIDDIRAEVAEVHAPGNDEDEEEGMVAIIHKEEGRDPTMGPGADLQGGMYHQEVAGG